MQIPNVNQVYMMLAMFFALGVVLGDFPEISRSWWSNLKSFLNTNLTNIINSLNTAIQSSEKGTANGVATLGADGKIPDAQIPNLAIIDIITSAEATLAGYIANEWSAGSIQKGDAVQITLADGTVEIWQLFQNDGDEEADYKKIDASKVDWDNVLNKPRQLLLNVTIDGGIDRVDIIRNSFGVDPVVTWDDRNGLDSMIGVTVEIPGIGFSFTGTVIFACPNKTEVYTAARCLNGVARIYHILRADDSVLDDGIVAILIEQS